MYCLCSYASSGTRDGILHLILVLFPSLFSQPLTKAAFTYLLSSNHSLFHVFFSSTSFFKTSTMSLTLSFFVGAVGPASPLSFPHIISMINSISAIATLVLLCLLKLWVPIRWLTFWLLLITGLPLIVTIFADNALIASTQGVECWVPTATQVQPNNTSTLQYPDPYWTKQASSLKSPGRFKINKWINFGRINTLN